jgi:hypothetical protein
MGNYTQSTSVAPIDAIDKMRNIVAWADYQNEGFNLRVKSISDLEKLFDYANSNSLEFLDDTAYWEEDEQKHIKAINKLLGYKIY